MKDTEKVLKDLIDKSFSEFNLVQGSLVKASVLENDKKWVTLDVGFKSDGLVPLEEFQDHKNGIGKIDKRPDNFEQGFYFRAI